MSAGPVETRALRELAEATTEAVYGCEGEISGQRLAQLTAALDKAEKAGVVYPDAQRRGQNRGV